MDSSLKKISLCFRLHLFLIKLNDSVSVLLRCADLKFPPCLLIYPKFFLSILCYDWTNCGQSKYACKQIYNQRFCNCIIPSPMRLKADLTLLLVSIIWGSAFVAQRVAAQMGSVYLFNGARYLLAAIVVLPFAIKVGRDSTPSYVLPREQYQWMFVAGFVLFVGSAMQQLGVVYTTAGNAGFITGLYIVFVPIILFVVWREKVHWISILAVLLAGVGAFFLSTGGKFELHAGDLIELLGALFWTLHVIVVGKYASRYESLSFSMGQLIVCSLLNLGIGLMVEKSMPINGPLLAAIAYTAFLALGL